MPTKRVYVETTIEACGRVYTIEVDETMEPFAVMVGVSKDSGRVEIGRFAVRSDAILCAATNAVIWIKSGKDGS